MDFILSLPIVSYFLAPAITSWSTSLNLLFFYMTWSTLVLSHGALKIQLIGLFAIRLVLWLAPSLLFLAFDTLLPSVAASLKAGGASSLPSTRNNGTQLLRTFALAVFNLALSAALDAAATTFSCYAFGSPVFKTSTTLPLPWQLVKHLALLLAGRELLTYYIHRGVLHASSPNRAAKWHAQYAHARKTPLFSLRLFADHPVPCLLHRFVPLYLPAVALRPHLLVYFLYVALCTGEETLAMSGYSTVPGIIMGGIARRTAAHYASGGVGNYGAWGILDWAHGTTRGQDVMEDMKDEAEKHAVKERGENAASNGLSAVKEGMNGLKKGGRGRPRKTKTEKEDS
ncbi:sterol desaturase family [Sodiomyces alkalinus F11]|uniref:Sterol desaturase family n=1 Tax=Sodiomyces alkalinus (strain CBS 110278 / VKM F-3762 / F11) TaxID=1314773 RepID=A0A3N2PQA1_SODAK|nr:sterol desaturase family [Sodiomyces alkalinus F11]ROT36683.1 sterol desaturase family [Sodiomyces alkalinus F11]